METQQVGPRDAAVERLAAELTDVEASIAMVADGAASSVTLTGMHFGQQLAAQLDAYAESRGVHLETAFWLDDSACDITVSRTPETPR